mgnify:FL=1
MNNIIQQISEKLTKKILEKAYSGGICDIDLLSSSVLEDCKSAARDILEAIVSDLNIKIREDKPSRKARGLILKEKNRERSLFTEIGRLNLPRDYYYDKKEEKYEYLLDKVIGLQGYERISAGVMAKLVSMATEVSYAKSAETVTGDQVSRQCVRECILKLGAIEKRPQPYEPKRKVKELHLFADEDHVHMQREGRAKGKKSRMVPLVTVTEGVEEESKGRNRTINAMHFVDENFDTKALWKSVEGYIGASYDIESIEKIYIHADGGKWITNGLESFSNVTRVMDGFHLEKRLKEVSRKFPGSNLRQRIKAAMEKGDRKKLDMLMQEMYARSQDKKQIEFTTKLGGYLTENFEEIRNRLKSDTVGSCTEGQVSHILSNRFSRNPMGWSEEGLGKLSKQRVYIKNKGKIEASDFKKKEKSGGDSYREYADRIIEEACRGAKDFSIFEKQGPIFDGASGTQMAIRHMGMNRNILN